MIAHAAERFTKDLHSGRPGARPRLVTVADEMAQARCVADDVLLQRGDYQLAPAGSGHRFTATDTGVVIYAHGDLDLSFVD